MSSGTEERCGGRVSDLRFLLKFCVSAFATHGSHWTHGTQNTCNLRRLASLLKQHGHFDETRSHFTIGSARPPSCHNLRGVRLRAALLRPQCLELSGNIILG
jgi:hypothetical protein